MIPKETFRIQIEVKIFKKEVLEFSFLPSSMHEWSILFKWHVAPNSLRRNMYNTFWAKENDSGAYCGREQACKQSPDS